MPHQHHITKALERYGKGEDILGTLKALVADFPGAVTFSTSFGWEDQVITHLIKSNQLDISIFTLDTGRLFPETYSTWSRTNEAYGMAVKAYYPNTDAIESFVTQNGPNAFYEAPEFRKTCCFIRKVEPLRRALAGNSVWITGLRAEQSATRENMDLFEWDEGNTVMKYNPLLPWHLSDVKQYISANKVPYNPLHDKGFVSIGCAPCTRAIKPGEDFRAGRWWWEDSTKKECGLHVQTSQK
ncbi:MAG: phosphoadenylyl-sulfate reductase [Chitinophagaceae bacterium]